MKFKNLLAASTALAGGFLMPETASADPGTAIAIGNFLLASAGITSGSLAVIAAVGYVAIAGAAIGLTSLTRQDLGGFNPGEFKSTFQQAEGPEVRAVGRARLGGLFFFRNTAGFETYRGIAQCKGRIDAIENYFLGGREVVVDTITGNVESPPWARSGINYANIQSKVGDGNETAWPELVSDFPNLWTTEHRVRGVAQLLVRLTSPGISSSLYQRLYSDASVREQIETVVRAEVVYDPRKTSNSITDPTTHEWSENGIINAAHMLRTFPSIRDADILWDDIAVEADKADAPVSTRNGTEPRARAWGVWGTEGRNRNEVMRSMLDSIGADIFNVTDENGNEKVTIRLLDDSPESEITFEERDIISTSLKYGPESVERPNICRVKYYSPERNYELAELHLVEDDGETPLAWSQYQSEIDAVGEKPFDLELPFCPSAAQAQRLARRAFLISRASFGAATTNLVGLSAWGCRNVTLPFPSLLNPNRLCQIATPRVNDETGTVELPFIIFPEIPDWTPETDEALPLAEIPEIQFESDLAQPNAPANVGLVRYADNSYELRFLTSSVNGASEMEANYRLQVNGQNGAWQTMEEDALRLAYQDITNIEGQKVEVRYRFANSSGDVSYFSEIATIDPINIDNTKPDPPIVTGGVNTGSDTFSFTATATADTRIAAINADANGLSQARPFQSASTSGSTTGLTGVVTWTFWTETTNGTRSDEVIRTFDFGGGGGG